MHLAWSFVLLYPVVVANAIGSYIWNHLIYISTVLHNANIHIWFHTYTLEKSSCQINTQQASSQNSNPRFFNIRSKGTTYHWHNPSNYTDDKPTNQPTNQPSIMFIQRIQTQFLQNLKPENDTGRKKWEREKQQPNKTQKHCVKLQKMLPFLFVCI